MHIFDTNGDGKMQFSEFYEMLLCLAGLKPPPAIPRS